MRRLRRVTALLANLLLIQLVLAGGGDACMRRDAGPARGAQAAHEAHPGLAAISMAAPDDAPGCHAGDATPAEAPCHRPGTPGNCASMASCAPAMIAAAAPAAELPPPAPRGAHRRPRRDGSPRPHLPARAPPSQGVASLTTTV
jgi:hypothetical protein